MELITPYSSLTLVTSSISTLETHSLPTLARCYPAQLYLDHSHGPVLVPATLAALPSTRAIPDRDVFYVAHPIRSIQRLKLARCPRSLAATLRSFTFYVAHPIRFIQRFTWRPAVSECEAKETFLAVSG